MTGSDLSSAVVGGILALIIGTAAVTAAVIFIAPWLWAVIKPILHAWTS